jgi:hypothetical protein
MADTVLYSLIDTSLVEQTKSIMIEQMQVSLGESKFLSNEDMDKVVKSIREAELGSLWGYFSGLPGLIVGNMLFGLIVARFLRVKNEQDWLNDSEVV